MCIRDRSLYIVQVTADDAETLDLDNQKNRQTSIVYDINGNEYASLSRNENRIWRELSAMPENLQNAVIAIEDKNFRTEDVYKRQRPDGSTYHTFFMDPVTGGPVRGATCQGYKDDSCWARGQAWGCLLYTSESAGCRPSCASS